MNVSDTGIAMDNNKWWAAGLHSFAEHNGEMPQDEVSQAVLLWASDLPASKGAQELFDVVDQSPEVTQCDASVRSTILLAATMRAMIALLRRRAEIPRGLILASPIPVKEFKASGVLDDAARSSAHAVDRWVKSSAGIRALRLVGLHLSSKMYRADFVLRFTRGGSVQRAYFALELNSALLQ